MRNVMSAYPRPPADSARELAAQIDRLLAAWPPSEDAGPPPWPRRWDMPSPEMGRRRWPVPQIASTSSLARFLGVEPGELAWLADVRGLERTVQDERLRNYHYATIRRPGRPARVIERAKPRLKAIQRQILHEILDWIPAHEAAHEFTRGRSVVSHAALHTGSDVVIRLDLRDFFASIRAGSVYGILRTAGYPEAVAHALTGLCTNVVAAGFWHSLPRPAGPSQMPAHHRLGRQLANPHLPQGAPASPALANLAAFRLDRRLTGPARRLDATYTRYADDLTFSWPPRLAREAALLRRAVAGIAREEGFAVNEAKATLVTRARSPGPDASWCAACSCTTRPSTDRPRRTATSSRTSAPTCWGASPGPQRSTRRGLPSSASSSPRSTGNGDPRGDRSMPRQTSASATRLGGAFAHSHHPPPTAPVTAPGPLDRRPGSRVDPAPERDRRVDQLGVAARNAAAGQQQ
ncbi:MAG: reverse transcriptase family protein [Actinomycetota bacterium]|nr:reverse transcriptase family protein [Actinomycetota bacterium]